MALGCGSSCRLKGGHDPGVRLGLDRRRAFERCDSLIFILGIFRTRRRLLVMMVMMAFPLAVTVGG